jgi:hypothetical protein
MQMKKSRHDPQKAGAIGDGKMRSSAFGVAGLTLGVSTFALLLASALTSAAVAQQSGNTGGDAEEV